MRTGGDTATGLGTGVKIQSISPEQTITVSTEISGRTDGPSTENTGNASVYNHQHNIYLFGDNETRPDNYTIRIWKRIS